MNEVEFAVAVIVGLPPQVVEALGVGAIRMIPPPDAVGNESLTETLVNGLADQLESVTRTCRTAPSGAGELPRNVLVTDTTLVEIVPDTAFEPLPLQVAPLL